VLVCGASLEILESCQGNMLGHGVVEVLHLVSELTLVVTRRVQVRCMDMWPIVAHGPALVMSTHASVLIDSVGPPSAEVCRAASSFP
jgi:hypothetical protein